MTMQSDELSASPTDKALKLRDDIIQLLGEWRRAPESPTKDITDTIADKILWKCVEAGMRMKTMVAINGRTLTVDEWEKQLEIVCFRYWFDTIVKCIEPAGATVSNLLAKRKACFVRDAQQYLAMGVPENYDLVAGLYEKEFDQPFPEHLDGKDWREFVDESEMEGDDGD
jgi:hypothetical protein